MNVIQEINNVNDKFATEGSKLRIEKRGNKLNIRGSLPSKNNKNNFTVQRISLGLKADFNGLEEAKKKLQLINFSYLTILKFSFGIVFSYFFFRSWEINFVYKKTSPNITIRPIIDFIIIAMILVLPELVFLLNCI